jgi:hypothetical protein
VVAELLSIWLWLVAEVAGLPGLVALVVVVLAGIFMP